METSEQLDKFGVDFAQAQAAMGGAVKESNNPFFKSKYADLTSVWKASKEALHEFGFSVIQSPIDIEGRIGVETMLLHKSGQWVRDRFTLGVKKQNDPQADGSSITYARRYALAAFVGVCPVDDDGEAGMMRGKKEEPTYKESKLPKWEIMADEQPDAETRKAWYFANEKKIFADLTKQEVALLQSYLAQLKDAETVKMAGDVLGGK